MNSRLDAFEQLLRTWSTWYRLRRAARGVMLGLLAGLAGGCFLSASVLLLSWLTRAEFLLLGTGMLFGSMLLGALGGLLLPASRLLVTRFFDRMFRLKDRTSTALELHTQPLELTTPEAQALKDSQLLDALEHGKQVHPAVRFYFPWRRWEAGLLAALFVLQVGLFYLGQAPFQQAAQQRQVEQAIEEAAERIENLSAQVAQDASLSEALREQMLEILTEASQELNQATSVEQAVASLSETAAELQALDNAQVRQQAEALRQVGSQMQSSIEESQTNPLADFASKLAKGNLSAAAEALHTVDPAGLGAEETAALAKQLESAAEALAATNPELATALDQAAEALAQGDTQAAQQALQQAAQQLAQTSQQAADAQAAGQAAAQVAQSQNLLLQAAGQGTLAASGSQSGQGSQPGSGSQSSSGSGAGAGESSGNESQGSEASSSPIQPGQPGDGGEKPYTELFAPQRLGGSEGETVVLPPSNLPGELSTGTRENVPGQPGASSIPYTSVYHDYAQAYWQAYDDATIPLSLREVVRLYFSALGAANP